MLYVFVLCPLQSKMRSADRKTAALAIFASVLGVCLIFTFIVSQRPVVLTR